MQTITNRALKITYFKRLFSTRSVPQTVGWLVNCKRFGRTQVWPNLDFPGGTEWNTEIHLKWQQIIRAGFEWDIFPLHIYSVSTKNHIAIRRILISLRFLGVGYYLLACNAMRFGKPLQKFRVKLMCTPQKWKVLLRKLISSQHP